MLNACKRILDIHAPRKQKCSRGNHIPFTNKALSKEIMIQIMTEVKKKTFWKTVRSFLSDKVTSTKKITATDKQEIIGCDYNTAKVVNNFANIAEYSNFERLANKISDPLLKCL